MYKSNNVQDANFDQFIIDLGYEDVKRKGEIKNLSTNKIESVSFGETFEYEYTTEENFKNFCNTFKNVYFTNCYEGPLVKLWYDSKGKLQFSSQRKVDCKESYWGDKDKKFGDLFIKNGGSNFIEKTSTTPGLTHHFMILEPSLMVTTRTHLNNNECALVYLGTVDLQHSKYNIDCDPRIFEKCDFVPPTDLDGKIIYPNHINYEQAVNHLTPKNILGGENIMLFGDGKIWKIKHQHSSLRELFAGNTPNTKNRLYTLLDNAKLSKDQYLDEFPLIGCPTDEEIKLFDTMSNTAIENYAKNIINPRVEMNYVDDKNVDNKLRNILMTYILSTTLFKSKQLSKYWFDYINIRDKIAKTILSKSNSTYDFTVLNIDEKLIEFNRKGFERLKNLSLTSKNYARETKNNKPYMYNLKYSLYGLLSREYGCSLYRIEKCINYLE